MMATAEAVATPMKGGATMAALDDHATQQPAFPRHSVAPAPKAAAC
ncbi:hypothetical protein [Sphingobium aromaticiconvertens]